LAIEQSFEGMRGVNGRTCRRGEVGHPDNNYRFCVTGSEVSGQKASNDLQIHLNFRKAPLAKPYRAFNYKTSKDKRQTLGGFILASSGDLLS